MKFLRNLLATLVGLFIFSFLGIFIMIIILSAGSEERLVEIKDNTVLHLKLNRPILEREVEDPFEGLPMLSNFQDAGIGLYEFKEAIKNAAENDNVKGILLETPGLMAGLSSIDELRNALEEFNRQENSS